MGRPNDEVAALLQEYADLIAITGGDTYKARAYERAARSIGGYHLDIASLDAEGLLAIPNVGTSVAKKVIEYLQTGTIGAVETYRTTFPPGVRQMMAIPTLGPKRAWALYQDLGIASIDELRDAIAAGKLRDLKGVGQKTEERILHGIELLQSSRGRILLDTATDTAEEIVAQLSAAVGCENCTYAGSLRRLRETVGDIDIVAAAADAQPLLEAFTSAWYAAEVVAHSAADATIQTSRGLQVDLHVVPPEAWGAALQYLTGSKEHNIRLRELAGHENLDAAETEEEVYERLGLPWIPPTLRENTGEIEAALAGELPRLVEEADLRGDLHTHTNLTDGRAPLQKMVAAAAERGYSYYAITDHAPNLVMQRMTTEKMLAQREEVRRLQESYPDLTLLHGTELNIDAEGEVDWPDDFLAGFDLCVASVHSHFRQSRREMTARVLRAIENPYVHVIGHLTTRKIGRRPPVDIDLDAVFEACARTGTALEINSHPDRLDLRDEHIRRAKGYGVKFAIDSDAHSIRHLGHVRFGVGMAQRGWLTADDVVNTWPPDKLRAFLRKRRC